MSAAPARSVSAAAARSTRAFPSRAQRVVQRLRDTTIGTLSLLRSAGVSPPPEHLSTARAFADVATIGILHERTSRESESLASQLQTALNSRVIIEQAKGLVSFTADASIAEAFNVMRTYARTRGFRLSEVVGRVVRREIRLGSGEG